MHALKNNWDKISAIANSASILAMVKGNAYGHGLTEIASHLYAFGARYFAVATICECEKLVNTLPSDAKIVLLESFLNADEITWCSEHNVELQLFNFEQLHCINSIDLPKKMKLWVKVNTGMNRLGFEVNQVQTV